MTAASPAAPSPARGASSRKAWRITALWLSIAAAMALHGDVPGEPEAARHEHGRSLGDPTQDGLVLHASTEGESAGETEPPMAAVDAMLAAADPADVASLHTCMLEAHIPRRRRPSLFLWTALPRTGAPERVYFMRPAHKPYCFTFYGAHLFRFWLMVERPGRSGQRYQVRYAGVGDFFEVLPSLSHGRHDITETNCTASRCGTRWYRFDGERYRAYRCAEESYDKHDALKTVRFPCTWQAIAASSWPWP